MAINTILESYVNDFCKLNNFNEFTSEAKENIRGYLFEQFVNYCIFSKLQIPHFDLQDIHTGGKSDCGIDGFALIVNDHIIVDEDEFDFFVKQSKYMDVKIIFVQTKLSDKFEGSEILNFANGIENFFSNSEYQTK